MRSDKRRKREKFIVKLTPVEIPPAAERHTPGKE